MDLDIFDSLYNNNSYVDIGNIAYYFIFLSFYFVYFVIDKGAFWHIDDYINVYLNNNDYVFIACNDMLLLYIKRRGCSNDWLLDKFHEAENRWFFARKAICRCFNMDNYLWYLDAFEHVLVHKIHANSG